MKTNEEIIEEAIDEIAPEIEQGWYDHDKVKKKAKEKAQEIPNEEEQIEKLKKNLDGCLKKSLEYQNEIRKLKNRGHYQPVASPSEWIVEVDGEKVGKCYAMSPENANDFLLMFDKFDGEKGEELVKENSKHIRLFTKDGGVVMDNKME